MKYVKFKKKQGVIHLKPELNLNNEVENCKSLLVDEYEVRN